MNNTMCLRRTRLDSESEKSSTLSDKQEADISTNKKYVITNKNQSSAAVCFCGLFGVLHKQHDRQASCLTNPHIIIHIL